MGTEKRRATRDDTPYDMSLNERRPRWRVRSLVSVIAICALFLVLGSAVWLVFRALVVKSELEAAQALVNEVVDSGGVAADPTLPQDLRDIGRHADAAAAASDDPVWRLGEWVPMVGDNLRAVRLASESLDVLTNDIGVPALAAIAGPGDLPPLTTISDVLEAESPKVSRLADEVARIRASSALIEPVASGMERIDGILRAAEPAVREIPSLLGSHGTRNYLLVVQNTAEARALGGAVDSMTLLAVDHGRVSVTRQAPASAFDGSQPVDVSIPPNALALYGGALATEVNAASDRPDFPTAAGLLRAAWQRDVGADQIDGVVSVSPGAISQLLSLTGPLTVGEVQVTAENASAILTSDLYRRWDTRTPEGAASADSFIADLMAELTSALFSTHVDAERAVAVVDASISRGDLLVWVEDAAVSELLRGGRVAGVLPVDNSAATTIGVFVRDASSSKIDSFLDTSVEVAETCVADASTFTATTLLTMDIAADTAAALPSPMMSALWGGSQFRTEVFVYGPPGTTLQSVTVEGRELRAVSTDLDDLGRPVAAFDTLIRPSEAGKVVAVFSGGGAFGPVDVWTTPTPRPAEVSVTSACG